MRLRIRTFITQRREAFRNPIRRRRGVASGPYSHGVTKPKCTGALRQPISSPARWQITLFVHGCASASLLSEYVRPEERRIRPLSGKPAVSPCAASAADHQDLFYKEKISLPSAHAFSAWWRIRPVSSRLPSAFTKQAAAEPALAQADGFTSGCLPTRSADFRQLVRH